MHAVGPYADADYESKQYKYLLKKKFTCTWIYAVQIHVVQGSIVYNWLVNKVK